jgi:hypothetical protein
LVAVIDYDYVYDYCYYCQFVALASDIKNTASRTPLCTSEAQHLLTLSELLMLSSPERLFSGTFQAAK